MSSGQLGAVLRHLRRALDPDGAGTPTDAQLLDRFVHGRDESAFELLAWRHGGMVLGVCRRVLRQQQDAEDAFQATFLAFVRKAHTIDRCASVAGWLYRVASRIALAAKDTASRRAAPPRPRVASPPRGVGVARPAPARGGAWPGRRHRVRIDG